MYSQSQWHFPFLCWWHIQVFFNFTLFFNIISYYNHLLLTLQSSQAHLLGTLNWHPVVWKNLFVYQTWALSSLQNATQWMLQATITPFLLNWLGCSGLCWELIGWSEIRIINHFFRSWRQFWSLLLHCSIRSHGKVVRGRSTLWLRSWNIT